MASVFVELDGRPSGAEIAEYLLEAGVAVLLVEPHPDGFAVEVEDGQEQAALDALAGYVPTERVADDELDGYKPQLPLSVRTHANHLRDFEQAVRSGTPVTNAQTLHVIADIIAYIRLTEPRL